MDTHLAINLSQKVHVIQLIEIFSNYVVSCCGVYIYGVSMKTNDI